MCEQSIAFQRESADCGNVPRGRFKTVFRIGHTKQVMCRRGKIGAEQGFRSVIAPKSGEGGTYPVPGGGAVKERSGFRGGGKIAEKTVPAAQSGRDPERTAGLLQPSDILRVFLFRKRNIIPVIKRESGRNPAEFHIVQRDIPGVSENIVAPYHAGQSVTFANLRKIFQVAQIKLFRRDGGVEVQRGAETESPRFIRAEMNPSGAVR